MIVSSATMGWFTTQCPDSRKADIADACIVRYVQLDHKDQLEWLEQMPKDIERQIEISVIVPIYNEEAAIKPFLERCVAVLDSIGKPYEIIFAMDPSTDLTEQTVRSEIDLNKNIRLLVMSRRFGQPAATLAGLSEAAGNNCVVIDVDLQDPPELISELYDKRCDGFDVVLARRRSRQGETFIKRIIAATGYRFINWASDIELPSDTGDFRLMSRKVVNHVLELQETHGFLRGLVAYVGFEHCFVMYDRDPRLTGKGKYNRLTGSIRIGLNGLIGFSSRPLTLMSIVGFCLAGFSFVLGGWYVIQKISGVDLTPGLSTTVLLVTFFAGLQLMGLGIIGEYVGRIYDEVKCRPKYIINRKVNF